MLSEKKNIKSSNRTFGLLFSLIFLLCAIYFNNIVVIYLTATLSLLLFLISLIKPELLKTPNYLWICFGEKLGIFMSPIILFMIYIVIFIPIGLILRLAKVDNLRLRTSKEESYWEKRKLKIQPFKNQF